MWIYPFIRHFFLAVQLTVNTKSNIFSKDPHPHVVPLAWISLTLSRHFSLSFIASGRSSGIHPVSSHSCCMYVRAGGPAFAWPYVGVHRSNPTGHQLYGHLPPITKTIQARRTRQAGHCWRSKVELISDVLLWIQMICSLYIIFYTDADNFSIDHRNPMHRFLGGCVLTVWRLS